METPEDKLDRAAADAPRKNLSRTAGRTKSKLMDASLELFKERGYAAVTVDDITQAAGVAKGTFYTYFATKSDIIAEEFWRIDGYYQEYALKHLGKLGSAREQLLAFTRAQMKYIRDAVGNGSLKIFYANQAEQTGSGKMITNQDRQWHRIIRDIFLHGQENGEFRKDLDADRLTLLFNRFVRGVLLDWCVQDGSFDLVKEGVAAVRDFAIPACSACAACSHAGLEPSP
jgi:AcrR family transcriptional regulator